MWIIARSRCSKRARVRNAKNDVVIDFIANCWPLAASISMIGASVRLLRGRIGRKLSNCAAVNAFRRAPL